MILGDVEVHATRTDYTITVNGETVCVRPRDASLLGVSLVKWATNPQNVNGVGADALRAIAAELEREADRRDGKLAKACEHRCDEGGNVRLPDLTYPCPEHGSAS